MSVGSRDHILGAVSSALRDVTESIAPQPYVPRGTSTAEQRRALFTGRLIEYGAEVLPAEAATLRQTVERTLAAKGIRRLVAPALFPAEWLPRANCELILDGPLLPVATIEVADAVLTASTCAIAVSGSIILQHGPAEGRRILSLLPDQHLCVVRLTTLYETLPEALTHLEPTRPTTFISGPSATADIEMTRIQGVHGPRQLTVLLLDEETSIPDRQVEG